MSEMDKARRTQQSAVHVDLKTLPLEVAAALGQFDSECVRAGACNECVTCSGGATCLRRRWWCTRDGSLATCVLSAALPVCSLRGDDADELTLGRATARTTAAATALSTHLNFTAEGWMRRARS
jgi:hypothetical protein